MSRKDFDKNKLEEYKEILENKLKYDDVKYVNIEFNFNTIFRFSAILGWGLWTKGDLVANSKDWEKFKNTVENLEV